MNGQPIREEKEETEEEEEIDELADDDGDDNLPGTENENDDKWDDSEAVEDIVNGFVDMMIVMAAFGSLVNFQYTLVHPGVFMSSLELLRGKTTSSYIGQPAACRHPALKFNP